MSADDGSFQRLTDAYRYELIVHCYRMLGSLEDAEDALQETLLRAWRRLDTLKAQTALRAWLYKIATNVALDMLDKRKARLLPSSSPQPFAAPTVALTDFGPETVWIDPLPDTYFPEHQISPEAHHEALEYVSLAFLVALQHLPGRQRAVLLLCDVLDWSAQESADVLAMSVAAVNSALQRARATLSKQSAASGSPRPANEQMATLLSRYVQAWEAADIAALVQLLRDDAALTMPPFPLWFRGRDAIGAFLAQHVFAGQAAGDFRLVATRSNGAPAFALYQRAANGYALTALQVLTVWDDQIVAIDDFLAVNQPLFARLRLPPCPTDEFCDQLPSYRRSSWLHHH